MSVLPKALRRRHGHTRAAIREALRRLRRRPGKRPAFVERLEGLLGYERGGPELDLSLADAADPDEVSGNEVAIDFLRSRASEVLTFEPGRPPHEIPGVEGVRVYVLGPPRREHLLKQEEPRSGQREEVFLSAAAVAANEAFTSAVLANSADPATRATAIDDDAHADDLAELYRPFDTVHTLDAQHARDRPDHSSRNTTASMPGTPKLTGRSRTTGCDRPRHWRCD